MSTLEFWSIVIVVGAFLWWLSYVATARMRHGKNREREEIARRNLERHAREQAVHAEQVEPAPKQENH